jgi:signal transduction histidine kinase
VIVPDAAGQLWLGLNEGRLARRETNGFRVWGRPEGLDAGDITSLLPMDNGDLWLGSLSGLWLMREGRFHRFGREHGLPDDCAAQVLTDSQHSLWVGTRGGLCRVWLASVDRVLSGASDRLDAVVFDESDGLPSRTFAHRNGISALRAADGVLWWVTMRGLARCRPEAFPVNTVPVRPRLEEILVDGRPHAAEVPSTNRAAWAELSLAAVKQLTLTPGRHVVRLQFSAPCLSGAEKVRVQCRLTGQDAGWRQLGPDQRVEYHFVTPGENQLEVRAGNDDGLWSEAERALAITVEPRFVETPAFAWLLAGTVAAGLAGGGMVLQQARVRRRLARLELARSREAERTRIARDLHDELGARLTEISVLAQSARRELPPGDGPATRLASLTTKVNDLVTVVDEIVWAVDPTKDSLPALVRYVSGWVQEMAGNAGLECSLTVEGDVPEVPLDAETRHHLLLAVREAVTNAVRHAQARRLSLAVACPPGGLVITVADDGIGFDTASDRNGNGQHNLRDRLKAMHGSAEVMSGAGHGTRVVFTLPVPGTGPDVGK